MACISRCRFMRAILADVTKRFAATGPLFTAIDSARA